MSPYEDLKIALAHSFYRRGVISFGEFRLKRHEQQPDLPPAPMKINLRSSSHPDGGPLTEAELQMTGQALRLVLQSSGTLLAFEHLAGLPRAGEPLADWLALELAARRLVSRVRFSKYQNGDHRRIAAVAGSDYVYGERLLLIDDVISGAESKLEAVAAASDAGLQVRNLLVVVDRQEGGSDRLEALGLRCHAIFGLDELLGLGVSSNYISESQYRQAMEYQRLVAAFAA